MTIKRGGKKTESDREKRVAKSLGDSRHVSTYPSISTTNLLDFISIAPQRKLSSSAARTSILILPMATMQSSSAISSSEIVSSSSTSAKKI
jgi:hypothetical protein